MKDIQSDTAKRFGAFKRRYVPRILLAGPYRAPDHRELLREVYGIVRECPPQEFRLAGFGVFRGKAVYASIEPSEQLLQLRRHIAERLSGLCGPPGISRLGTSKSLRSPLFFSTDVPRGTDGDTLDRMLQYMEHAYELDMRGYALRITVHGGNNGIVWEYDMVLKRQLSRRDAQDPSLLEEARKAFARGFGQDKPATVDAARPAGGAENHEPKLVWMGTVTGAEFEGVCADILRRHGFNVKEVGGSADGGRDIIIRSGVGNAVVECKHQAKPVGRPAVQKLHSVVVTDEARCGILISTSGFTSPARAHKVAERADMGITGIAQAIRALPHRSILLVGLENLKSIAKAVGIWIMDEPDPTKTLD